MNRQPNYQSAQTRKWAGLRQYRSQIEVLCNQLGYSPKNLGIAGSGVWISVNKWCQPVLEILRSEVVKGPIGKTDFARLGNLQQTVFDTIQTARADK